MLDFNRALICKHTSLVLMKVGEDLKRGRDLSLLYKDRVGLPLLVWD